MIANLNDPHLPVEPFTYFLLPNDHTNGTSKGAQTPQSMIANNDEATGRFIDGLSRTQLWKSSVVFVVEDDPGGTLDHVEEHRSICLVASPWVKRGYVSSTQFDLGSVYRTIELILGVGPMNLNDGARRGHVRAVHRQARLHAVDLRAAAHARRLQRRRRAAGRRVGQIDFTKPDQADLTRILWKAVKGRDAEPPTLARPSKLDVDDDD